eukprot:CFRG6027T1
MSSIALSAGAVRRGMPVTLHSLRLLTQPQIRRKTSYSHPQEGVLAKPKKYEAQVSAESWNDYYTEIKTGSQFVVKIDHLSQDKGGKGPSPLEYALSALAGCKTSTFQSLAKEAGFTVEHISYNITGEFDPRGYGGVEGVYGGFRKMKLDAQIKTSLSAEQLVEATEEVQSRCVIAATYEKAGVEIAYNWQKVE